MTTRCTDLDPFFDGELPDAPAFRVHLAGCARCQDVLLGRMLEAALVAQAPAAPLVTEPSSAPAAAAPPGSPPPAEQAAASPEHATRVGVAAGPELPPGPEPTGAGAATEPPGVGSPDELAARRRPRVVMLGGLTAIAAAALALLALPPAEPDQLTQGLGRHRTAPCRFSAPQLDGYRPPPLVMAAAATPATRELIPLQTLADLERRGQAHALVAAYTLNDDFVSAERVARALPVDARGLTDRAAVELARLDAGGDALPGPRRDALAQRALSFATDALRLAPALAQARWNQAVALERLGLTLGAARAYASVTAAGEPGWAVEALHKAAVLRGQYEGEHAQWRGRQAAARRLILGAADPFRDVVDHTPSLARDAFYQAVATAATVDRLDALAPLARALDDRLATSALTELLARVRGSALAVRAPFADELRAAIALGKPARELRALRGRAVERGLADLALASFLAVPDAELDDADVALLARLAAASGDPWWPIVAHARGAYLAMFRHTSYAEVDAIVRRAAPACAATPSTWCDHLTLFAGDASIAMGRADVGLDKLTATWRRPRGDASWDLELAAIHALGQAIELQVTDDLDSAAVSGAYMDETVLRKPTCRASLQRLDIAAYAALQRHRVGEAAQLREAADELERGACRGEQLRLNGEAVRVRIAWLDPRDRAWADPRLAVRAAGNRAWLRPKLAQLAGQARPSQRGYVAMLDGIATLIEDRARGERALREVIASADRDPDQPYQRLIRTGAFDALIEAAAAAHDAPAVVALLAERIGAPRPARCALGVASWNRLVVAVVDARGEATTATTPVPEGQLVVPPSEVVPSSLRARLAGCARVDVLAPEPYVGTARLLGAELAWAYRVGPGAPAALAAPRRELVVSDVSPPADLHLPALQPFPRGDGATLLAGRDATPDRVLGEMATATLAVIVAHGVTDASEPTAASLILSPDPRGDYLLTASKVSAARLTAAPIVILAGCDAGRVQVSAEPWSLATSFIRAGARVVMAPTEPIPDARASELFGALVDGIRAGADPADALADARRARGDDKQESWLNSIVVFQ